MSELTQQCIDLADSPGWDREKRPWPPGVVRAEWQQVRKPLRQILAASVVNDRWPIYIHGIQGCGKTSAVACMYRSFKGHARWILLEEFVRQVLRCRKDGRVEIFSAATGESFWRTETQWMKLVSQSDLLCVDDIGLRPPTEAAYEVVFNLINSRLGRKTIYTSNLPPDKFAQVYGRRIASRVLSGMVIETTGVDQRERTRKVVRA